MLSGPSVMSPSLANGHGHVGDTTPPLLPACERPGLKLTYAADADTDAASKKRKRDDHGDEAKTKKKARKEEKKAKKEERGKRKEKKEKRRKEKKAKKEEDKKKKEEKKKKLKKEKKREKKKDEKEPKPPASDQDQAKAEAKECPAPAVAAPPTKSLLKKSYDPASSSAPPTTPPMPPAPPAGTSPAQQRKSVTFAADVKQTDGDSIKQLYLALDPFGKNRTRGRVTPAVNGRSISSPPKGKQEEGARSTEAKEAKQQQQQQRHIKRGGSNNDGSTKPYLDYLANFHLHRLGTATATTTHWKFEKAKQNWILKNALDPEAIPASCHEALGVYVAGLQGTGARDRLLAEAKSALVRDDERLVIRAKVVARALGRRDLASDSDGDSDSDSDGAERVDGENAGGKSTDGKSVNGKSVIVKNRAASSSSDSDSSSSSESDSDSD